MLLPHRAAHVSTAVGRNSFEIAPPACPTTLHPPPSTPSMSSRPQWCNLFSSLKKGIFLIKVVSGGVLFNFNNFYLKSYLVQGSESIHVGCVDVGSLVQELDDLSLVPREAGGQEDASGGELDPSAVLGAGCGGGPVSVRFLPPLQLLGPLHHRRVVARVQSGHFGRVLLARWSFGEILYPNSSGD